MRAPGVQRSRPDRGAAPPLGVAGSWGAAEIDLYRRFDELHQLLYRRGGLDSSNAAVDEVAKLMLVRLWATRHPDQPVPRRDYRQAFAAALRDPALSARDPSGRVHPVWPLDEPFRLTDPDVLAAADELTAQIVAGGPSFDALGTAFDALLAGRYDHTGGLGTYLTPSGVARMMAEIAVPLVPTPPQSSTALAAGFGDPYCGTGRFLVALLTTLPADHPLRLAGPFGTDVSPSAVAKARLNLLLYGVPDPLVWTVSDAVTDSTVDDLVGTVPLILTNPPFGEGKYDSPAGIAAAARLMPALSGRGRIDPSLACLARAVSLLSPGGVLGIVLPDGVLGSAAVRDLLARTDITPLAVVSLPPVTFALSGTVARTSALFLRRRADAGREGSTPEPRARVERRIVLARVDHVGYVSRAGLPAPDPAGDQLPAVAAIVARAVSACDGVQTGALGVLSESPLVVVADAGTLDVARLDPAAVEARRRLVDGGGVLLAEYLRAVPPRRCRQVTLPYVSVLHVDDLGVIDWHAAGSHAPVTPGVLAEPGEVLVSLLNPASPRAAVVPPGKAVQVSAEFAVFQSTVDPYAVLALLYCRPVRAQLRPLGTGTSSSRRRITADDVLALVVPKLDPATLDELAATVRSAQQSVTAARTRLRSAYDLAARSLRRDGDRRRARMRSA